MDGGSYERQSASSVIVAGSAKVGVLADSRVCAQMNLVHAVAVDKVTQTTVVLHHQIPRRPYASRLIRPNALADFCAEQTKQHAAPGVHGAGRGAIKQNPDDVPE